MCADVMWNNLSQQWANVANNVNLSESDLEKLINSAGAGASNVKPGFLVNTNRMNAERIRNSISCIPEPSKLCLLLWVIMYLKMALHSFRLLSSISVQMSLE